MGLSSDLPISLPAEDRFSLSPFAAALANSIAGMEAPSGVVLAVNGEWGAGKSSAINLVKHYLIRSVEQGDLVLIPFNPWWFTGSDTLTLAFFQELNKAIGPSLPEALRKSISKMGQGVSAVGAIAGALANLKVPGLGAVVTGVTGFFRDWISKERTVEEEHRLVSEALTKQKKRFLVIVDDIDRLSPDDVLTIFRLVKSVGRLPNVIYLLAFDRKIAERIVADRFPSEGPSYLEKILQGAFELPPPQPDVLRQQCVEAVFSVMGQPDETKQVRFWNVFHDVVSPMIRTPRDVAKLSNQVLTTWPAVAGNVDRADFLAITALQMMEPDVYAAIRQHQHELCGARSVDDRRNDAVAAEYDEMLTLAIRNERERRRMRIALRRLFPRLDSVWSNTYHSGESWRRDRLIASPEHFRSYFAFCVSDDVVPSALIDELISRADDPSFVQDVFRKALLVTRRTGATQASLLLDELTVYAPDIAAEKVGPLTDTLFSLADELHVDGDASSGMQGIRDNQLKLHWLLNRLIHERFSVERRDEIYRSAMNCGAVDWVADFAERCYRYYQPRTGDRDLGDPIVSQHAAEEFVGIALGKIRAAAVDGTLIGHRHLTSLLFAWRRLAGEGGTAEVRAWTDASLEIPAFVVALALGMPSSSWSLGIGFDEMGDRVQRENVRVNLDAYRDILDVSRLETRVDEELRGGSLSMSELDTLRVFRSLPRGRHDQ